MRKRLAIGLSGLTIGFIALGGVMAKSVDREDSSASNNRAIPSSAENTSTIEQLAVLTDDSNDLLPAPLPRIEQEAGSAIESAEAAAPQPEWKTVTVKNGDNLSLLGERNGIGYSVVHQLVNAGEHAKHLNRLRPGDELHLAFTGEQLDQLRYRIDEATQLLISRTGEKSFESKLIEETLERRVLQAHGEVDNSLFLAAQNAGLPQALIMELAGIFGWDIDFALDVREGDRFSVVYEAFYRDGKKVRIGRILSAEYINQGESHRAAWYQRDEQDRGDYYDDSGRTLRKAFLRAPLDVVRITSHFNPRRKHPTLHKIRAHKGTDYGAPTGTPIRATGDGKVISRGSMNGYGKTVVLRHGSQYTTLYAHMSRFARGVNSGTRVKQGQIIGYVGATGRVSGPHLHYEFQVNGVHRNPLKVKFPGVAPISDELRDDFASQTAPLFAQLDAIRNAAQLALND